MDSTSKRAARDEIADMVVDWLTRSSKLSELATADLETIEDEVVENIDAITRSAISKLLDQQRRQSETPQACPQCGGCLSAKPAQRRTMQSRRGNIHFSCDVFHCPACRRDFFPSV
ncbi:MAG TPA: hypothetical protein VFV87_20290 [Pirellulaceae bacterium]|nr:hypothetical protein [Pirellulaceae bacterium]